MANSKTSFIFSLKSGTTKIFIVLSFEPVAINLSLGEKSKQYIEPAWSELEEKRNAEQEEKIRIKLEKKNAARV